MKPLRHVLVVLASSPALGLLIGSCGGSMAPAPVDPSDRYFAVHNAMQASGMAQVGTVSRGQLASKQSVVLPYELGAQCVTIMAMGGRGVADLELSLRDAEGKTIAKDDAHGADATLRFCAEQPGKHELQLLMAEGDGAYVVASWTGGQAPPSITGGGSSTSLQQGGGTCDAPTLVVPGQTYVGNTEQGESSEQGSCGNANASEQVYRLDVPVSQRVSIDVRAQYDSVLYVRRGDCTDPDAEVACNDDVPGGGRRSRIDEVLEPGTYFIFVDGYGEEEGSYRMRVRADPAPDARTTCDRAPLLAANGRTRGSVTEAMDTVKASCGKDAAGPDRTYRLELETLSRVRITQQAVGFAPVVHVRRSCGRSAAADAEVGCSAEGYGPQEASFVGMLPAGSHWVVADASEPNAVGDFELGVEVARDVGERTLGDSCGEAIALPGALGDVAGDTFAARDDIASSCSAAGSPEVVYRLDLVQRARFLARVKREQGRHRLALQTACGKVASELACGPTIDRELEPGTYFLVVSAEAAGTFGRFEVGYRVVGQASMGAVCGSATTLTVGQSINASTQNASDSFMTSCGGPVDAQASPDKVYQFTLKDPKRLRIVLRPHNFVGAVSVRSTCGDVSTESECRSVGSGSATAIARLFPAGTYYVVVDGMGADNAGDYTLDLLEEPAR